MIRTKPGVILKGWTAEMWFASQTVEQVYDEYDLIAVCTAGLDGVHKIDSLHYKGKAGDFRTRQVNPKILPEIQAKIRIRLGPDYDVVLEMDHLHIEFDLKGAK